LSHRSSLPNGCKIDSPHGWIETTADPQRADDSRKSYPPPLARLLKHRCDGQPASCLFDHCLVDRAAIGRSEGDWLTHRSVDQAEGGCLAHLASTGVVCQSALRPCITCSAACVPVWLLPKRTKMGILTFPKRKVQGTIVPPKKGWPSILVVFPNPRRSVLRINRTLCSEVGNVAGACPLTSNQLVCILDCAA
jgi:hypothetical protein